MINKINGLTVKTSDIETIIEIGPLQLRAYMPQAQRLKTNEQASLYTSMIWNQETGPSLFCFLNENEREIFELVRTCPGIGGKTAILILHNIPIESLASAIENNEPKIISKAPGIGLKKAEMIILKLKNKIKNIYKSNVSSSIAKANIEEIIDALESLGYKSNQIIPAITKVSKEKKTASTQELISETLKII
jgi:holliday junction DNA helicase RuvA